MPQMLLYPDIGREGSTRAGRWMGQKRAKAAYEMIDAEVLQRLRCGRRCDHRRRWRDLGMRLELRRLQGALPSWDDWRSRPGT
jgi:hypothetical protein